MAQLSNDCFASGDALRSLDDAVRLIAERVSVGVGTERVPIMEAQNRVLAEEVMATCDLPPFDNSAVDGYAVNFDDLTQDGDTILSVSGRIAAGDPAVGAKPGTAIRIFTGAAMPTGLDTVFMQEDVRRLPDGRIALPAGLKRGANRRLAGEDLAHGRRALGAGRRLAPADLGLLGAFGLETVPVRRRLRVAIASTGNEVARPGDTIVQGRLFDANRPMLAAFLRRLGCEVGDMGILPDERKAVAAALAAAAHSHDLFVTSGGVSTGEEDHVRAALSDTGALAFWRLGIKPGRPVAMGVVAGTPFIGLPGNPVAVFVTFVRVARHLIARLQGEDYTPVAPLPVVAAFSHAKKAGRREYLRVRIEHRPDGSVVASKHPREGAGIITSLTETDGLVELPEAATQVEPGEIVGFLPYGSVQ